MSITKQGGSVKDVDDKKGIVTGYFSAFGNLDSDGDIIEKGAYEKTISERGKLGSNRIKHVVDHGFGVHKLLGVPDLKEDEKGLRFETKISQTALGRDVIQLYIDEVITEHSVRIEIIQSDFEENGVQRIKEVRMWEGSSVVWGANPDTPTLDVKSAIEKQLKRLTKANKDGNYTDNTHLVIDGLVKQLTQLRSEADKAIEAMNPFIKTPKTTQTEVSALKSQLQQINNQLDNFKFTKDE